MRAKVAAPILCGLIVVAAVFFWRMRQSPVEAPPVVEVKPAVPPAERPRVQDEFASLKALPAVQPTNAVHTNILGRLVSMEGVPHLTDAQVEPYLTANKRNAGSLLAAFRATGDKKYLLEAMAKSPNDPRVNFAAVVSPDVSPEDKRLWLNNFKQADPNNALPNYFSALDDFKSGHTDLAMQEMAAAAGKPGWSDYSADFAQNAEEAYLAVGYPPVDAIGTAMESLILPQMAQLKQLGVSLGEFANSAQLSGDPASARAALQADLNFGSQIANQSSSPLITTLVGMAIENIALKGMDPNATLGDSGQTVQDQINQIAQQRASMRAMTTQFQAIEGEMSDQDVMDFFNRSKLFGELPAMQWALNKYGTK